MTTSWSPGAEVVYGWTAEEVLGRPAAITFTLEDREAGMPEKELAVAHREGSAFDERWHVRKDGSRAFIEGTARVLRGGDGGEERGFLKFGQDVTERRALEEERGRLREVELTARAEAAERERISRELHDRVAHTMAVAHQSLQLHEALAQSDPSRAAEKLERAAEATRTALNQTRDLSAQLARSGMEETRGGLVAALRDLLPPGHPRAAPCEGDALGLGRRILGARACG
jgi:PAS domain S-box-containing protein